ncbi:MAG: transposase [Sutterellaceae bacterium]|nr:transposase [Sutterellaceae bacterium]
MRENPKIERWHFRTMTNAKGYTYIHAYSTAWDPVKKKSTAIAHVYGGRLYSDGSIKFSPGFKQQFPQYAQGNWFWGADKMPVTEMQYRRAFPAKPGPKTCQDEEEEVNLSDIRRVGLTWAAEQIALRSGMLADLQVVFGKSTARKLLDLAIFTLCKQASMDAYKTWCESVYLTDAQYLSGQRISELLAEITCSHWDDYFKRRHEHKTKQALDQCKDTTQKSSPLLYALDNTTISTYSKTIEDAEHGNAKQNPELEQINYTVVCDQKTGEIVYAHTYNGSINDVTELSQILHNMRRAGFDLSYVVLVTDRGYSSLMNVQKMINLDLRYVQGVRLIEGSIKEKFDTFKDSFAEVAFYDPVHRVYARSFSEPWTQDTSAGRLHHGFYLHLYRFPHKKDGKIQELTSNADIIAEFKNGKNSKALPSDTLAKYKKYVKEIERGGKKIFVRDNAAITEATKYEGCFVIRSNEFSNPFEAMSCYHQRGIVELDFKQFKNQVEADRLNCTESTYRGKLFVNTLATSIRLMMLRATKANETPKNKLPNNSLDNLMERLDLLYAERRHDANAYVCRTVTKKQRDMFALLGLLPPPKILR